MTSRDFVYWLQGYFEIAQPKEVTSEQLEQIKKHLALVFVHEIDPAAGPPEHQAQLNALHHGKPKPGDPAPGGGVYRC